MWSDTTVTAAGLPLHAVRSDQLLMAWTLCTIFVVMGMLSIKLRLSKSSPQMPKVALPTNLLDPEGPLEKAEPSARKQENPLPEEHSKDLEEVAQSPVDLEVASSESESYNRNLMLMHRELSIRIARGPPGLEPAPANTAQLGIRALPRHRSRS
mmetsp:Transcript_85601/g.151580  ORF Transcript_85601/g.151580 Transcript_85601/m.151580 type:complete len:154 (-) Transcript_85601:83-544(-)|eukprot:CAMPEP_0197625112 /NCGR_PEP_ID=MMETSP1338-20131121/4563_1 /TAXON_ID=43686 ORGANISM="Pelagodinium beii, Strain RCC1491" /NCGR_SAMPLE_ID=MMETSP1338 /ASSEMBLY_ACC=CAM_ASM_000754 /LENGTH=153 /DNA_ID=CAMNT_0043195431 /DNA_START=57 /DNA_END=518 /DNA_ORIENTATION=-